MNSYDQKKSRYLIQFLLDHASPEIFFNLVDEGATPNLVKYVLGEKTSENTYKNSVISRNIVTGYPSTSANSHVSILTGSYAGKNNLLYTTFWDVLGKIPRFINVERMSLSALKEMNKKHINPNCKTLFEYLDFSASFHAINRGAKFKLLTLKTILFKFLPLLLKLKKKYKSDNIDPIDTPELWKIMFRDNITKFLNNIRKKGKFPRATFIVFLLSDGNAHKYGFNSHQYRESVQMLDYFIKCLVEGLENKKGVFVPGLKELGYLDSIIWNICTDHSGRKIARDKFILIDSIAKIELNLNLIEGDQEEREKILEKKVKNLKKIDAFTNVGGELWHCWFGKLKAEKIFDFKSFFGEEYFRTYIPRKFLETKDYESKKIDLINYFISQKYVQFVIIPEDQVKTNLKNIDPKFRIKLKIPRDYIIKIFSKDGVSQIIRTVRSNKIHYSYKILQGQDPLYYNKLDIEYEKFFSHNFWLEKTIIHDLPDIFHRLFGFFDCIYAPNFIITSELNYHFISIDKLTKKGNKAISDIQTHDGLYKIESVVPLTISGPGIKKGSEIMFGRNIDILPTVLKALGVEYDKEKIDGEILSDALNLREN
ncbi:MAG: alkaline phosphatase family protein [Promethearchaeota archaeon]